MKFMRAFMVLVLGVMAMTGCQRAADSSTPPVATPSSAEASPQVSPPSTTKPFVNQKLTTNEADTQSRVILDCTASGTATYSMYVKEYVYLTVVEHSPDCWTTKPARDTAAKGDNRFNDWVLITPESEKQRIQTYLFCTSGGTALYWMFNTDKGNPFGGTTVINGAVVVLSAECS